LTIDDDALMRSARILLDLGAGDPCVDFCVMFDEGEAIVRKDGPILLIFIFGSFITFYRGIKWLIKSRM
jgi:hypothetical protein